MSRSRAVATRMIRTNSNLYMNKIRNNISHILVSLAAGACFQGCQNADIEMPVPDRETWIAQSRYLTARNAETAAAAEDPDKSAWFETGTPYRLLAFTKAYSESDPTDETVATYPRFNKVAWDGEISGLRYINLASDPGKWFGFAALDGEPGGTDNLVSLDFYGFTYGKTEERTTDYIEPDGLSGETTPAGGTLTSIKRTETLNDDGELRDLMRAQLLNQNITTVSAASSSTQSILPFRHCFSQLQFMIVQQADDTDGNSPRYTDIYVDRIDVTGTYSKGAVYLQDGKVELNETDKQSRTLRQTYSGPVPTAQTAVGEMIVFPSDGSAMKEGGDGYAVGLSIVVKGSDRATIENFLVNSGSTGTAEQHDDGLWYGTIAKDHITDMYLENTPLYLKQNTSYTIVISFQDNTVRVAVVIPQIEEWLTGEGTTENPWQDQVVGQPQTFGNTVWSDRNLGADHFDPEVDFEGTVGYFYQNGRNIPYWPFNAEIYYAAAGEEINTYREKWPHLRDNPHSAVNHVPIPDPVADKRKVRLATVPKTTESWFHPYPMVDSRILTMPTTYSQYHWSDGITNQQESTIWCGKNGIGSYQLDIPKTQGNKSMAFAHDQGDNDYLQWEKGASTQPVPDGWAVPTPEQYAEIFPTEPFAGNITFRGGGYDKKPSQWCCGNEGKTKMSDDVKVLRITVPYYSKEHNEDLYPGNPSYQKARNLLIANNDEGITHEDKYTYTYANSGHPDIETETGSAAMTPYYNRAYFPKGDPADGYASVYILSRDGDDSYGFRDADNIYSDDSNEDIRLMTRTWGVIYAIKKIYTPEAYRMRWRVMYVPLPGDGSRTKNIPGMYIEVCRYSCTKDTRLDEDNYKSLDWDHPVARIYFPISGYLSRQYYNLGTEGMYATSGAITKQSSTLKCATLHIKMSGEGCDNQFIALTEQESATSGKQLRLVRTK